MTPTPEYLHSELPAIDLFRKMGYGYYDGALTDERETIGEVILTDRLQEVLYFLPEREKNRRNPPKKIK